MSLIAGQSLKDLVSQGIITALPNNVNAASIDIRIGDEVLIEDCSLPEGPIDIDAKESMNFVKMKIPEDGMIIYPGQCFLAHSVEYFNLPDNISSEFVLRSSMARNFLNHMLAGWCDAGWNGSQLTLEFKNESQFHPLLIKPNMRVGQMKFFQHESAGENSYAKIGNYNNQSGATAAFSGEGHGV